MLALSRDRRWRSDFECVFLGYHNHPFSHSSTPPDFSVYSGLSRCSLCSAFSGFGSGAVSLSLATANTEALAFDEHSLSYVLACEDANFAMRMVRS